MTIEHRPGLEGISVARTALSSYDGEAGTLVYRNGHPIENVARHSFEEVAHLLLLGEFPRGEQLAAFNSELTAMRSIHSSAREALDSLPRNADEISALQAAVSMQGAVQRASVPCLSDALRITSSATVMVAAAYRRLRGIPELSPRQDLGHAANFLYLLKGREPSGHELRCLETYMAIMADHGFNPSTFAACVVASTGSDMYSAVAAAVGALKGRFHGGATRYAWEMVRDIERPERVEPYVASLLSQNKRIMGFGHREYRTYDPRAIILRQLCREYNPDYYGVAAVVEEVVVEELRIRHPGRPSFTNVDFYAGGVLEAAGIPPELFTCAFAISRVVGWTAHVLEYVATDGKLISPTSIWVGGHSKGVHSSHCEPDCVSCDPAVLVKAD